jgi:hypothetical protein
MLLEFRRLVIVMELFENFLTLCSSRLLVPVKVVGISGSLEHDSESYKSVDEGHLM